MRKLVSELRRRNVFRVAAAYAIVTWLLIQAADILLGNFGAPEWVFKSFVALLLLGFPLALFLAWAYELTPEGVKRSEELTAEDAAAPRSGRRIDLVIAAGLIAVIAFLVVERVWYAGAPEPEIVAAESPVLPEELPGIEAPGETDGRAGRSIAVLPFADLSPGRDQEYFSDGITEEILATLARLGDLRVISRTSVMRYKGTDKGIPEIARELGANTVLEGSVRRAGDEVRITAQLIDPRTDHHLWAETYDRTLSVETLFVIQSEIARHIADALQAEVTDAERERMEMRPTGDLAAYDLYLRSRQLTDNGNRYEAIELLHEALALDADFALAEVALAQNHAVLYFMERTDAHRDAAQAAGARALASDPRLPEAHALNALLIGVFEGRADESRQALERALELNPNSVLVLWALSNFERIVEGRLDEALDYAMRARMIGPLEHEPPIQIAHVYETAGAFGLARRWIEEPGPSGRTLRHDHFRARLLLLEGDAAGAARQADEWWGLVPRTAGFWRQRGEIELLIGRLDHAREAFERERQLLAGETAEERLYTDLAWIYLEQDEEALAEPLLVRAEEIARGWLDEGLRPQPAPCALAAVHAMRGEFGQAMEYLERLHAPGFVSCIEHGFNPRFRDLRGHPRYEALAARHEAELARIRERLPMIEPS